MIDELAAFRRLVNSGIRRSLCESSHCKPYEGEVRFEALYPSYFEPEVPADYTLELRCYVLGPSRRYVWKGTDAAVLFAQATADVTSFIAELEEEG